MAVGHPRLNLCKCPGIVTAYLSLMGSFAEWPVEIRRNENLGSV
jgi:hypothetical protein